MPPRLLHARRRVLGGLALGAATLLSQSQARGTAPPARPAGEGDPPPLERVHVLLLGDSLAQGMFLALQPQHRNGSPIRCSNGTQHATGLTRTDEHDWTAVSRQHLGRWQPDVAIFWIGANDFRPLVDREARARHPFGSAAFAEAYGRRVAAMVQNAVQAGARPVWLGLPNMRDGQFAAAARTLNEIQQQAALASGAIWAPTWEATSDGQARYQHAVALADRPARALRAEDGVHFTEWGYRRMAELAFAAAAHRHPELAEALGRPG